MEIEGRLGTDRPGVDAADRCRDAEGGLSGRMAVFACCIRTAPPRPPLTRLEARGQTCPLTCCMHIAGAPMGAVL